MYNLPLLVFNHGIEFPDSICNDCHDLTILCLDISDIAIITVKGVDYHCIIHEINESEAIHFLENYGLKYYIYIYIYTYIYICI